MITQRVIFPCFHTTSLHQCYVIWSTTKILSLFLLVLRFWSNFHGIFFCIHQQWGHWWIVPVLDSRLLWILTNYYTAASCFLQRLWRFAEFLDVDPSCFNCRQYWTFKDTCRDCNVHLSCDQLSSIFHGIIESKSRLVFVSNNHNHV